MVRKNKENRLSPYLCGLGISRRKFLGRCAACAGAAGLMGAPAQLGALLDIRQQGNSLAPGENMTLRMPYALYPPQAGSAGLASELGWKVVEEA